jgi:hypothetical protein
MAVVFNVDGQSGRCAIYTGTDDAPMTAPLDHISRLRFHSDLAYPKVISVHTGSINLPALSTSSTSEAGTERIFSYNLFAHGQPGTPYVEGLITSGLSRPVTLAGSVVVASASGQTTYSRVVHLGADSQNVFIRELSVYGRQITISAFSPSHGFYVSFPALTLGWKVFLTDVLV